jgi:hypothetical protein
MAGMAVVMASLAPLISTAPRGRGPGEGAEAADSPRGSRVAPGS